MLSIVTNRLREHVVLFINAWLFGVIKRPFVVFPEAALLNSNRVL